MSPVVKTGDLVILDAHDQYFIGEIIQFKSHNVNVLHRIVDFEKGKARTKGDANTAQDPLLVNPKAIGGVAVGTLRGFGIPILFFRNLTDSFLTNARFTKQSIWRASAGSSIWINPTAKWKTLNLNDPFTFAPPNIVSSYGSGVRTIFMSKVNTYDKYFYSSFRLTTKDPTNASISLLADACTASSLVTCGWAIGLSDTLNTISVSTFSSNGTQSSVILQKNFSLDFSVSTKIVLYSASDALRLFINDAKALEILNPASFAQSKNVSVPTGSYFGFVEVASNQFRSSKTLTW